jgi:CRISPR/Cas system-associated endonuclease/helicase Cas3
VLKDKIQLRKEVRAVLTVEEFDNFRLLVTAGFVKGTRVKYIGDPKYAKQYEGLELEVNSIDEHSLITCRKPNGAGYTTRLKPDELEKL